MNINHGLLAEVLRLKDASVMFPDQREKKPRILNILRSVAPTNRPGSHIDWWLQLMADDKKPRIGIPLVKPTEKEVQPYKSNLSREQKDALKSMSYKFSQPVLDLSQAA